MTLKFSEICVVEAVLYCTWLAQKGNLFDLPDLLAELLFCRRVGNPTCPWHPLPVCSVSSQCKCPHSSFCFVLRADWMVPLGTSLVAHWSGLQLPLQRAWVWSLVGELGSHMLCGAARKRKVKKIRSPSWIALHVNAVFQLHSFSCFPLGWHTGIWGFYCTPRAVRTVVLHAQELVCSAPGLLATRYDWSHPDF